MHDIGSMRDNQAVATEDAQVALVEEVDVVDAEPVIETTVPPRSDVISISLPRGGSLVVPTRVARGIALTLSGFTAGAVTAVLSHRGQQRRSLAHRRQGSIAGGKIVASRSLLIDLHVLDKP